MIKLMDLLEDDKSKTISTRDTMAAAAMTVGGGKSKSWPIKKGESRRVVGDKVDGHDSWKARNKSGKLKYFYGSDAPDKAKEYATTTSNEDE